MRRKREIVCFETGERFASVTDAASAIGAARPLVSSALKRHGACRGFHFYYADEAEPDDSVFDRKVIRTQDQSSALRRTNVLKVKQGQQKRLAYRERLFMRH